jgi:hypothetical protein
MIRIASVALPKSPMNLAQGAEVPQIITRRTRQRPSEFLISPAKRLFQHNRGLNRHKSAAPEGRLLTQLKHGGGCDAADPCPLGRRPTTLFTVLRWRALSKRVGRTEQQHVQSSSFLFRPGLCFRGRCRHGLSCEPFGFQTLAVLRECCLGDLVLAHCRCGIYLAKRLTRFPLGPGDLLRWVNFTRSLRHFFAFGRSTRASLNSSGPFSSRLLRLARTSTLAALSPRLSTTLAANSLARVAFRCVGFTLVVSPSSTSRRIASERVASLVVALASTSAISAAGIRVVAGVLRPVGSLLARPFR